MLVLHVKYGFNFRICVRIGPPVLSFGLSEYFSASSVSGKPFPNRNLGHVSLAVSRVLCGRYKGRTVITSYLVSITVTVAVHQHIKMLTPSTVMAIFCPSLCLASPFRPIYNAPTHDFSLYRNDATSDLFPRLTLTCL